jgi:hypothetical protein
MVERKSKASKSSPSSVTVGVSIRSPHPTPQGLGGSGLAEKPVVIHATKPTAPTPECPSPRDHVPSPGVQVPLTNSIVVAMNAIRVANTGAAGVPNTFVQDGLWYWGGEQVKSEWLECDEDSDFSKDF